MTGKCVMSTYGDLISVTNGGEKGYVQMTVVDNELETTTQTTMYVSQAKELIACLQDAIKRAGMGEDEDIA